jgi:hypothetical protein
MSWFIACLLIVGWVWHHAHKHGWHPGRKMYETRRVEQALKTQDQGSGWIYFACGPGTPVMVGASLVPPTVKNVPWLRLSGVPMRIVHKYETKDMEGEVRRIIGELMPYHVRQSWFDRDATLFYVDHLKGAV